MIVYTEPQIGGGKDLDQDLQDLNQDLDLQDLQDLNQDQVLPLNVTRRTTNAYIRTKIGGDQKMMQ
jgi:hypothetical protein